MDTSILQKEREYLSEVVEKVTEDISLITNLIIEEAPKLEQEKLEFNQEKGHLFNSASSNFDTFSDLNAEFNRINDKLIDLDNKNKEKVKLTKTVLNPYFGRVDVQEITSKNFYENYIGLKTIYKRNDQGFYVIDWRTPIAGLFYDNEKTLSLNHNAGQVSYSLVNKRQYKIKNSKLEFCFDSDVKIDDEMLQEMLGKNSSEKMKNIVSSIQHEQNKVIRFNEFNDVYVLGVAGSGKTSIALHRVAYLLFKLNGKVKSTDFLILSPNKVFSNYISNVMHELNEENVGDKTFEELLLQEFGKNLQIENKQEYIERIISKKYDEVDSVIFEKQKYEFLEKLVTYLQDFFINNFTAKDIIISKIVIPASLVNDLFVSKVKNHTLASKLTAVMDDLLKKYFLSVLSNPKVRVELQKTIRKQLYDMVLETNTFKIYKDFLSVNNIAFTTINGKVRNEDIYPALLIKFWVTGTYGYDYKHLVVDEVQDYSAVQLFLINWLFKCPKTILGDTSQSINASLSRDIIGTLKNINKLYNQVITNEETDGELNLITLNKSYRNGYEITKLANSIIGLENVEFIKRAGEKPEIIKVNNLTEFTTCLVDHYNKEFAKKYKNIAIITKSQNQAIKIYGLLKDKLNITLLTDKSKVFNAGLSVLSVYQSKGLEFDAVMVYNVNDTHFVSEFDKHLLYIAVTRALSEVKLIYSSTPSKFIEKYFYDKDYK